LEDANLRTLNEKDNEILKKLAPEAKIPTHYRSILPPVSTHYATDEWDLQDRFKRLSAEDLQYLADRILDGSECLLCISPEAAAIFLDLLEERVPGDIAKSIRKQYNSATGYNI
jgi:hypothetical protein